MKNRQPTYPGRVKLTPVPGSSDLYDMERADQPTVEGTPLNKSTLLQDTTALLYGMTDEAVPDDILALLVRAVPSPYGLLIVRVTDQDGNPIKGINLEIHPDVIQSGAHNTDENGYWSGYANAGTYSISTPTTPFSTGTTVEAIVKPGYFTVAPLSAQIVSSGVMRVTTSQEITIPFDCVIDLFACGGGGSGSCAGRFSSGNYHIGIGGAGGYTQTIKNIPISAGSVIKFQIGAGGQVSAASVTSSVLGVAGGTTSILVNDEVKCSANGGPGGVAGSTGKSGVNGGSGSAAAAIVSGAYIAGAGGQDGSNGGSAGTYAGGTGQRTTTREFGDPDGELYASAGASIVASSTTQYGIGTAGPGGGPAAMNSGYGGNATRYGCGGGSSYIWTETSATVKPGSGFQGVAAMRWRPA